MSIKRNEIQLALAFDEKFVTPFYVLLTSIFFHNKKNLLVIHSIANNVDEKTRSSIRSFVTQKGHLIHFYDIDSSFFNGFAVIPENTHYTKATYFRLLFPSLLPKSIDKIIYLDVDTIVIGDLLNLYNLEIHDYIVAASVDMGVCGALKKYDYFNAGVLLINVNQWRKNSVTERTIVYLNKYPERIRYADQDALNYILSNDWLRIDSKFNITFNDIPELLKRCEYADFVRDKIVIHYTGIHKPWSAIGKNRLRYLYHLYKKLSPRSHERKYTDLTLKVIGTFIRIRLVERFRSLPRLFNFFKQNLKVLSLKY